MGILAGRKRELLAALVLMQAVRSFGQATPAAAFEAASIKPTKAEPGSSSGVTTKKGSISARNVTLKRCIRSAYDVQESRIVGPKWLDDERYDIDAKAAGPAGDRELMAMLQSLLSERFRLAFHRETRELPGYALVAGKIGFKAKPSQPDAESRSIASREAIECVACNMRQLAQKLAEVIHFPVADMTGVEGAFDFQLKWTPDDMQAKPPSAGDKPAALSMDLANGPSVFAALQEQLGLRLEPRKVPTEVLVIDHAEKASEN